METARGYNSLARRPRHPVVAIGNFDGVHRGHVYIFEEARRLAGSGEVVVLTFEPHPARLLAPALAPPLITPLARKLELIAGAGVDVTIVEPFTRELAALSPETFVERVLEQGIGAERVCIGHDFTFGHARAGTPERLVELGRAHGFEVTVVPPVAVDGMVCSSTKVREFVLEGRVDGARAILGRDPEVQGAVGRGAGRGRTVGIPTANVRPETELLPKNGVYAGWAERLPDDARPGASPWRGRRAAAINVGTNPTFVAGHPVSVEAHLLDTDEDLYGTSLRLGFVERLRDEKRFENVSELVAQIGRDIEATRARMGQP